MRICAIFFTNERKTEKRALISCICHNLTNFRVLLLKVNVIFIVYFLHKTFNQSIGNAHKNSLLKCLEDRPRVELLKLGGAPD